MQNERLLNEIEYRVYLASLTAQELRGHLAYYQQHLTGVATVGALGLALTCITLTSVIPTITEGEIQKMIEVTALTLGVGLTMVTTLAAPTKLNEYRNTILQTKARGYNITGIFPLKDFDSNT